MTGDDERAYLEACAADVRRMLAEIGGWTLEEDGTVTNPHDWTAEQHLAAVARAEQVTLPEPMSAGQREAVTLTPPPADRGDWMQTYSGAAFYPVDPRPEEVKLIDIAHSLGMQCRFAGHCIDFYSVAEHCVRASLFLSQWGATTQVALIGLLHDAPEAYTHDLIRPIKRMIRQSAYDLIESRVTKAVGTRFGVDLMKLPPEVKHADEVMLSTEARDVMAKPPQPWIPLPQPLVERIVPWSPREAKLRFLERFMELTNAR